MTQLAPPWVRLQVSADGVGLYLEAVSFTQAISTKSPQRHSKKNHPSFSPSWVSVMVPNV